MSAVAIESLARLTHRSATEAAGLVERHGWRIINIATAGGEIEVLDLDSVPPGIRRSIISGAEVNGEPVYSPIDAQSVASAQQEIRDNKVVSIGTARLAAAGRVQGPRSKVQRPPTLDHPPEDPA
jgi:hypothetical protein